MARGSSSLGGEQKLGIPRGQVLADDGVIYETTQEAHDNATEYITLGPGTHESLVVDTPDLTIEGIGESTIIDAGDGMAIRVLDTASGVTIRDMTVRNDNVGTTNYHAIFGRFAPDATIDNVTVAQSEYNGIWAGPGWNINRCNIEQTYNNGVAVKITDVDCSVSYCNISNVTHGIDGGSDYPERSQYIGNRLENVSGTAIISEGPNDIVLGNMILDPGNRGITINGPDIITGFNSCTGVYGRIKSYGTNSIIANNRAYEVDTTAATTPVLDANITNI